MKRRKFIQRVASTGIVLPIAFGFPRMRAFSQSPKGSPFSKLLSNETDRVFVIIRLAGGNDGLNTVVPYENDVYYNERFAGTADDLSIAKRDVLKLSDSSTQGFHPSFEPLVDLYEEGKMAIVQNVGYPGQNLSHFRSTDIWLSGSDYNVFDDAGWYAKYLEEKYPDYPEVLPDAPFAIEFGNFLSTTLIGDDNNMGIAIGNLDYIPGLPGTSDLEDTRAGEEEAYVREVIRQSNVFSNEVLNRYIAGGDNAPYYTDASGPLGQGLAAIARMLDGGLSTRMFILNVGGYDTHTGQSDRHAELLSELAHAVSEFHADLDRLGLSDRVCTGTISEFGRRVRSNGTGTDHGSAAPMFVFGDGVLGGLIGSEPDLEDLEGPGNLKLKYDFRQVYASILGQWYSASESEIDPALPHDFEQIPIFKTTSGVSDRDVVDSKLTLGRSFPNPAVTSVTIPVAGIPGGGTTRLAIYDQSGREVYSIQVQPGTSSVDVDVSGLASGSYTYALTSGGVRRVERLVVAR